MLLFFLIGFGQSRGLKGLGRCLPFETDLTGFFVMEAMFSLYYMTRQLYSTLVEKKKQNFPHSDHNKYRKEYVYLLKQVAAS